MRRLTATIVSVMAIVIILYWMSEATSHGAPWIFSLFGAVMIALFVISLVRTWLRG